MVHKSSITNIYGTSKNKEKTKYLKNMNTSDISSASRRHNDLTQLPQKHIMKSALTTVMTPTSTTTGHSWQEGLDHNHVLLDGMATVSPKQQTQK